MVLNNGKVKVGREREGGRGREREGGVKRREGSERVRE